MLSHLDLMYNFKIRIKNQRLSQANQTGLSESFFCESYVFFYCYLMTFLSVYIFLNMSVMQK